MTLRALAGVDGPYVACWPSAGCDVPRHWREAEVPSRRNTAAELGDFATQSRLQTLTIEDYHAMGERHVVGAAVAAGTLARSGDAHSAPGVDGEAR
jgi:hypothetical protein